VDGLWLLLVGLWVGVIVGAFALALGVSASRTPPQNAGGALRIATESWGQLLHTRVAGLRARLAAISRHLRRLEAPPGRLLSRRTARAAAGIRTELLILKREVDELDVLGAAVESEAYLRSPLPAAQDEKTGLVHPEQRDATGMHGPVLVVEDDAAIRELVAVALKSAGFEVLEAADGVAALQLVERWRPTAIVLDLALPRMDGAAFAHELRRRRMLPGIPIIVLSAVTQARQQAAAIGAEVCLSKPFAIPELVREVVRVAA
jgi:CheY-like chemotaxis protein